MLAEDDFVSNGSICHVEMAIIQSPAYGANSEE